MRDSSTVLRKFLVSLDFWSWRDFFLEPVAEGGLFGDFTRGFEARDDGGCVVAFGVGEVAEIEGGLDAGIGGSEVDATS